MDRERGRHDDRDRATAHLKGGQVVVFVLSSNGVVQMFQSGDNLTLVRGT